MRQARPNKAYRRKGKGRIWLFPALLLVMAAALLLVGLFALRSTEVKLEEPVYQYFSDQKVEYPSGTSLLPGKYGVVYSQDGQRSEGDATPIYTAGGEKLILSESMYWLETDTGREWQIPGLSSLWRDENGSFWCSDGKKQVSLSGGFLGNAGGVFVFLDEMSLRWNGQTDKTDPFSFFSIDPDGQLRVYRYGAGELLCQSSIGEACVGTAPKGYQVDFSAGIYTDARGSYRLLVSDPKVLPNLFG